MKYWLIFYIVGYILAASGLIKKMMRAQPQITVRELFYAAIVSLLSWVGYVLFDEDFGDFVLILNHRFANMGSKAIWRKKNDKPIPGRDPLAVELPRKPDNV